MLSMSEYLRASFLLFGKEKRIMILEVIIYIQRDGWMDGQTDGWIDRNKDIVVSSAFEQ